VLELARRLLDCFRLPMSMLFHYMQVVPIGGGKELKQR